jgi:DNA-binding MarR family transcriptional regulator
MYNDHYFLFTFMGDSAMIEIEKSVGFLLAKAYQRACALFKEEFDSHDLTPQQFGILAFLWIEDGLSQAELSSRSQIDRTTMGGIVDRLEKDGMVKRFGHPDDRRAYQVFLTPRGKSLEEELSIVANRVLNRVNSPLTTEEQVTLVRLLEKIRR